MPPLQAGGGRLGGTGDLMIDIGYHVSTMVGPGIQSLAWAMGHLGWPIGLVVMIVVAIVTYHAVTLQAAAYNYMNSRTSNRDYTDAVRANLGGFHVILYWIVQFLNLFSTCIGYTIAATMSMKAIVRSICFYSKGHNDSSCKLIPGSYFMIGFGGLQIILSQINNIDKKRWFIVVAASMSFVYPIIGAGLAIANIINNEGVGGSLLGMLGGKMTKTQKIWTFFQAFGVIFFSLSYVLNSINNQINLIESPPSLDEIKKKSVRISLIIAFILKSVYGSVGFGDTSPHYLLSGSNFWVADIANAAIVIHVVGAYQIFCQPLFASIGENAGGLLPHKLYRAKEITIPGFNPIKLNLLSGLSETIFVIITIMVSVHIPFFNYVIGISGAVKFCALTVYFPVQIHIAQNEIRNWSLKWFILQLLSATCFLASALAAAGSVAGIVSRL